MYCSKNQKVITSTNKVPLAQFNDSNALRISNLLSNNSLFGNIQFIPVPNQTQTSWYSRQRNIR